MDNAREIILDHARRPRGRVQEEIEGVLQGECLNPLCGDHVRVFVALENGVIASCSYQVRGCNICVASASLMSEAVQSLTLEAAREVGSAFSNALQTTTPWPEDLRTLHAFSHLRVNPSRIGCALLAWQALCNAQGNDKNFI